MKFGGTSLADASTIEKALDIIRIAATETRVVVVVSAMSGVTNKLLEAAVQSERRELASVAAILEGLRKQHDAAVDGLIHSRGWRKRLHEKVRQLLQEGAHLCRDRGSPLIPQRLDAILSLGERLSAPLVAAALVDRGLESDAVEATQLVITNSVHGAAKPDMNATRRRCKARLRPLLQCGTVPVVTGFIGATPEGVLTTLGRNSSDYSATIMAAALDADEVTIWTDVDGVLSADPRLVPSACSISEISYREAAALARFGAKVLHPKTLCPLKPRCIPLCIRNTFASERPGTKITAAGDGDRNLKALAAIDEIALITVVGTILTSQPDVIRRALATTRAVRGDVMLVSRPASQDDIGLVVSSAAAEQTVASLRTEFSQELAHQELRSISLDPAVALVTVVGQGVHGRSQTISRTFDALSRVRVNILAIAQHSRAENLSLVLWKKDVGTALVAMHQEFQLGTLKSNVLPPRPSSKTTAGSNQFGVDCRLNYRDRGPRTLELAFRESVSLKQKRR